jgi:hypothetical protein
MTNADPMAASGQTNMDMHTEGLPLPSTAGAAAPQMRQKSSREGGALLS